MNDTLTPLELYEKYPVLQSINWGPEILGTLLRVGLLRGTFSRAKNSSLIDQSSLFELMKYRNDLLEKQKLTLK